MSALIIGSGNDIDKELLKDVNIEYCICADGGLEKAEKLGILPDIVLGDFDSVDLSVLERYRKLNIEIMKFPKEKDFTDMELAVDTAVKKGFKDIVLVGATGTRLDHSVANILLIAKYYKYGANIKIMDNNNYIEIVKSNMIIQQKTGYYVSIIPYSENIEGLTLMGFKYPLTDVNVEIGSTLCISNEISEKEAVIKLNKGNAFIFVSKD